MVMEPNFPIFIVHLHKEGENMRYTDAVWVSVILCRSRR